MREFKDYICFSLQATNHQVKKSIAAEMAEISDDQTNMMQCKIIGFIHSRQDRDVFQKDIEDLMKIQRSTATGMLNTLEKKELIYREPVSYDARLKKLVITPKGIEFSKKAVECIKRVECKVRSGLSEEELETFFHVLNKIKKNMEDIE